MGSLALNPTRLCMAVRRVRKHTSAAGLITRSVRRQVISKMAVSLLMFGSSCAQWLRPDFPGLMQQPWLTRETGQAWWRAPKMRQSGCVVHTSTFEEPEGIDKRFVGLLAQFIPSIRCHGGRLLSRCRALQSHSVASDPPWRPQISQVSPNLSCSSIFRRDWLRRTL